MSVLRANIEGKQYDVIVAKTQADINKGMSIYQSKPVYGMLFMLMGNYSMFTMNGVKFPIMVYLYDKDWKLITKYEAKPGEPARRFPKTSREINNETIYEYPYYMIEIPI